MKSVGIFLGVAPSAGGMFQYAISILDALKLAKEKGWKVKVAYVGDEWKKELSCYPFIKESITNGGFGLKLSALLMVVPLPTFFVRFVTSLISPISWKLRKMKCDLWIFPAQEALAYQMAVKSLATIHDLMHIFESHFPEVSKGGRTRIRNRRFRNIAKFSKGILVDSNVGKKHVIDSYQVRQDIVYPLPYIPSPTIRVDAPSDKFEERYSLPEKFIFYPAQFWEHKNHLRLLEAAVIVKRENPGLNLLFTGMKIRNYEKIKSFIDENFLEDNVHFTGYIKNEDLGGFYARARAMMMPTFFGPTNIPPLEAFICKCPVAVSRIYGMPEQLGDGALYFDPLNVDEIASVMKTLWENDQECSRLIKNGLKKNQQWNLNQFSSSFVDIIEGVYAKI